MPYTQRPFNPNTPYENQVETELELANNNFEILSQAFVSNNPETFIVKRADTVDGFHASLTPAPNVIVPLNSNGVLDLSASYVKSGVYTFRRINLTFASSDYYLQVGEEALINFHNTTSVPLKISTHTGTLYNLYIYLLQPSFAQGNGVIGSAFLYPNNTTYTNAFYRSGALWDSAWNGAVYSGVISAFELIGNCYPANCFAIIYNEINHKSTTAFSVHAGINTSNYARWQHINCVWNNYTINWASLGTITFPIQSSGYILVRRLL